MLVLELRHEQMAQAARLRRRAPRLSGLEGKAGAAEALMAARAEPQTVKFKEAARAFAPDRLKWKRCALPPKQ